MKVNSNQMFFNKLNKFSCFKFLWPLFELFTNRELSGFFHDTEMHKEQNQVQGVPKFDVGHIEE